jgi:hypothetical protein
MRQCRWCSGPIPERKGTGPKRVVCLECDANPPICAVDGCMEPLQVGRCTGKICRNHQYRLNHNLPLEVPIRKRIRRGPVCSMEGCGRPHHAQGWCTAHLNRAQNGLSMEPPIERRDYSKTKICTVDGCNRRRCGSRHFCPMHLARFKKYGEPGEADRKKASAGAAIWDTLEYRRRYNRLKIYGLRPEEFDALLERQNSRCAVCRSATPGNKTLCVDHDHVTGQVRGLLCDKCNRAIGLLRDDPSVLKRAREYMLRHRQTQLFGPAAKEVG